jgi:predicted alpha/beta-hydrolase family hydrolase
MAFIRETQRWRVEVGGCETSTLYQPAADPKGLFVFAHGAGGHMEDPGMQRLAAVLHDQGLDTLRFNFMYRALGARRPDLMPRLIECFEAVVALARTELGKSRVIIGGRSMGGRAASMMASEGFECDGLLLFAYPLHPPGKPERLRAEHLSKIRVPVLCINGTRDTFCTRELMEKALESVHADWTMHWLAGADHSFRTLKSSGKSVSMVYAEVGEICNLWLARQTR